MIRSNLCNCTDAYIHVKSTIIVPNTAATAAPVNKTNKEVIFRNFDPFSNSKSEINNKQVDDVQDIDRVIPMYNLEEYRDVYLDSPGSFMAIL